MWCGIPSLPGVSAHRTFITRIGTSQVLKGTWWVSLGPESDSGDQNKMIPIKAGGYVFHPANGHHFDGAKTEDVTVQIIGMGPVTTTRVKPTAGTAQR